MVETRTRIVASVVQVGHASRFFADITTRCKTWFRNMATSLRTNSAPTCDLEAFRVRMAFVRADRLQARSGDIANAYAQRKEVDRLVFPATGGLEGVPEDGALLRMCPHTEAEMQVN